MKSLAAILLFALAAGHSTLASAADVAATNCEAFVDKVRLNAGSHGFFGVKMYVKVLRERLDGDVVASGFYGDHRYRWSSGSEVADDGWRDYQGSPFLGAADYFEVSTDVYGGFTISADYSSEHLYEGAFYVRTSAGTTYWIHAADSRNFQIYHAKIEALKGDDWSLSAAAYRHMNDIRNVPSTADRLPYFNPGLCR